MARFQWILFDWGGTLMSEDGPEEVSMAFWPEVRALPGARATLSRLSRTHRLGIATNASVSRRNQIEVALERASLRRYISRIFCFTELGFRKDTAQFWEAVTRSLELSPRDIAMVGDSIEQDVLAPRRCGIYAVWYNEDNRQSTTMQDVPTITRLADLVPLIDNDALPSRGLPGVAKGRTNRRK